MEMLNSVGLLLSGNLWITIINFFADWIVNYGWAIIVFTICLKLVLSPIDIFQRISSQKQARMTSVMKPEMDALQAKYANDRVRLNQEMSKLYKKYNVNMGGMCLPMLISLLLTLVIFFTLYSSIRTWGNDNLYASYKELDNTYISSQTEYVNADTDLSEDEYIAQAVNEKYDELAKRNSWLWVKNVWKSDTGTTQFVDFDDYANYMNYSEDDKQLAKERYDFIVSSIDGDKSQPNGYYILIVLAAGLSLLTQFVSAKLLSPKGAKLNTVNKVMMVVIPITMIIFASTSNAVFTLYIIFNSLMSAIISTTISLIMRKNNQNDGDVLLKRKNVEVVEYSRNYKK